LSQEETERLDRMTRAMIKKFLHDPITFLRHGRSPSDLQFTRELFNLRERDDGEEG
jgi:glutamyl-tRNA reductase